jgi:GntR family transcriptional regulator
MDELGEIGRRTGVAYHHQLYALLLRALGAGHIAPGTALPTESALMQRFRISRNTVRRALGRLEQEKRIVRRRGSGSYARSGAQTDFSAETLATILHDFTATGSQTRVRVLRVMQSDTPEYIRKRDPAFGNKSVLVQRCRSYRNEPFMLSTSYVPEQYAKRMTRKELLHQPVLLVLDKHGIQPASADQTTTAVAADAAAVKYLAVELSAPLLSVQRLIRDSTGRSIEYQSEVYRPDRYDLRANVAIERSAHGLRWTETTESRHVPAWL